MSWVLLIVLFGLGGILVGGAISVRKQGSSPAPVIGLLVLAAVSVACGVFWLVGSR